MLKEGKYQHDYNNNASSTNTTIMNDNNIPSNFINVDNVNKNTSERLGGT